MVDIKLFKKKKELDARAQVDHFIQFCRYELTLWEEHIDWDTTEWDLTASIAKMGRKQKNTILWTKMSETKRVRSRDPMAQPFGDFARAFIRYYLVENETCSTKTMLIVFRVLEKALSERAPDGEVRAEQIDSYVLDRSAEIIRKRYAFSAHYDFTNLMILIHRFLVANCMVNNPCGWSNPFPYKTKKELGTDDEIRFNRNKKLPTEAAYYALLEINAKCEAGGLLPRDEVTISNAMVCCANPDRSAEISMMRWDLIRDGHAIGNKTRLFLTWYPVKGGRPLLKPVPEAWEKVTSKAIERLQKLSSPARKMALWYEKNPDRIYLPAGYKHLRNQEWLTEHDVQTLLGISKQAISQSYRKEGKNSMKQVARQKLATESPKAGQAFRYLFADFEQYVLSQLPKHFPYVDPSSALRYQDMLNIYPVGLLNTQTSGSVDKCSLVMFSWFDANAFESTLSGRAGISIFGRHDYYQDEARTKPLSIKTHQLRHMNVTMDQQAGLSDVEMAKRRGSHNVAQNSAYKHCISLERMKAIGMDPEKGVTQRDDGRLEIRPISGLEIKELRKRGLLQLHENEFGLCAHPIEQEPCPRFLDCLGCTEQLCKVGDEDKTQRIEKVVRGAKNCLTNAVEIKQDDEKDGYGTSDADPWIRTQKATIVDGEALVEILRDPNIPKGTWVKRIGRNRYDPFIEMVAARAELTGAEEDIDLLEKFIPRTLTEKFTTACL